jgi:hypothetical protein
MGDKQAKSIGHIGFTESHEYFTGPDGSAYRAPRDCPLLVCSGDWTDRRNGARFECPAHMIASYIKERIQFQA